MSGVTPCLRGPVTALCITHPLPRAPSSSEDGPLFRVVVGGVQGVVKVLDPELQPLAEFNLYRADHGLLPLGRVRGFKSLCIDKA